MNVKPLSLRRYESPSHKWNRSILKVYVEISGVWFEYSMIEYDIEYYG